VTDIDPGWRPPTLTTDRLVLRAVTPDDAASVFRHASNPNVARYTAWDAHTSIQQSASFVNEYAPSQYLQAIPEPVAITLRENPAEVIGVTGCNWASRTHCSMELGFWVGELFWGRGYAAEAARAMVNYVFSSFTVERVQAHCVSENTASGRALEKAGLKFEGVARSAAYLKKRFWDLRWYAVVRADI
jgi:ribosomal-protein-alanine N-acetyltransferase